MIEVNRNFVYEMELGHHKNTIYALHKVYLFFGYIPKALKINEMTLSGQLFTHRIMNGFTYQEVSHRIGLDKSSVRRFEQGSKVKHETKKIIENYLSKINRPLNHLAKQ